MNMEIESVSHRYKRHRIVSKQGRKNYRRAQSESPHTYIYIYIYEVGYSSSLYTLSKVAVSGNTTLVPQLGK